MQTVGVSPGLPHGLLTQAATLADTTAAAAATAHGGVNPTLVVKNPVPGFIGQMLQVGFNLPAWAQAGLAAVGALIGGVVLFLAWKNREQILAWLNTRSNGYKMGLFAMAAFMVVGGASAAYAGNHYMEHNNDFCMSCHVMGDAWTAFQKSEHRKLECHNCHRQGMVDNVKQLYFWIAERPSEIPAHAKVPTKICSECHVQSRADSGWKRIIRTAGHRLHMESDSSALKEVACVTCHGQEVHRFKPVDKTCGQTGCHQSKDTKIVLGRMAGQTSQHCTGCHTFTRVIPENISIDSTRQYLKPTGGPKSCFGCHQMKDKLKGFNVDDDKGHKGVCGTCHNPHKQNVPKMAYESCAQAGCHADVATKSPFHAKSGKHASPECGQCHQAHTWKPIGTQCVDCHKNILNNDAKPAQANQKKSANELDDANPSALLRPIAHQRNVTTSRGRMLRGLVVRRVRLQSASHARASQLTVRRVRWQDQAAAQPPAAKPAASLGKPKDSPTFSHKTHKVLACGGCHSSTNGTLLVKTKADCATCHHAAERPVACEGCHVRKDLEKAIPKTLSMRTSANTPVRTRTANFYHAKHRDLECKGCHTNGVMLGVTKDCASCHTEHHEPERACSSCHTPAKSLHQRASHDGCAGAGCHSNAAVLALPPSRTTCLVCHTEQVTHKPKRECAECHAVTWTPTARGSR
jgi:nitrate/TMAO reductase-like tetraheme cytochrome c subunit